MEGRQALLVWITLCASTVGCAAFSTYAGSCEHAGVQHGLDLFEAQGGDGAHAVYVEGGGKGILEAAANGAAVKVTLHNSKGVAYKGLNVFAVDTQGKAIGDWPGSMQAPGLRAHPMCDYKAVCHQAERSSAPRARDDLRFVPPPELRAGDRVTFRATVVRDYSHWWAFEQTFTAGLDDPAQIRPQDVPVGKESQPSVGGIQPVLAPGIRAPGTVTAPDGTPAQHLDTVVVQPAETRWWPKWVSARVHAWLMVWAFLILGPCGVLTARYLKGNPNWLTVHIRLQLTAVAAAVVAVTLALVDLAPINAPYWHGEVGLVAVGLMLANPLAGYFRPDKGRGKLRSIWYLFHANAGWAALLLGVLNIVTGLEIAQEHRWAFVPFWAVVVGGCGGLVLGATAWLEVRKRNESARVRAEKF